MARFPTFPRPKHRVWRYYDHKQMEAVGEASDQAAWDSLVEVDRLTVLDIVDNETDGGAEEAKRVAMRTGCPAIWTKPYTR